MSEATEIDVVEEVMVQPVVVDVYAYREGDDVLFAHSWKREGDSKKKMGRIDIPRGDKDVPIHFKLHDRTGPNLHLRFISIAEDAMWVDLDDCPTGRGNGDQITFVSSSPNLLKVVDKNDADCILHFALRFDGDPLGDYPPYEYDPEIRNGGGGFR